MKLLLFAILISAASADNNCKGFYIKDIYYDVEIIKEGINKVHELVFNGRDYTAYFTFEQYSEVPTRMLGYVDLTNGTAGVIDGIRNATALATDQNRNRLYVGGSDGLYFINLNKVKKVPQKLAVDHDIRSLFFKGDVVYFVNAKQEAYKFEYGVVQPVYELAGKTIDKLILDDDNNIMFLTNNKPYRIKLGTKLIVNAFDVFATDIATDTNYKPYVCAKDGLYSYNKYKYDLDKLADLKDIKKIAFASADEPIYIVVDTLAQLKRKEVPCVGD